MLFERKFRVPMDVATDLDELREKVRC